MKRNKASQHEISRKEFLVRGAAALAAITGAGQSLKAENRPEQLSLPNGVKSVVFLNMMGGMSHVDTFDPKQTSMFRSVPSSIPGVSVGEPFARTAKELHRINLIRTVNSDVGDHEGAQYLLHTGHKRMAGFNDIPSFGAVIAFAKQSKGTYFPEHITIGGKDGLVGEGGFLGNRFTSFHVSNIDRPIANLKPAWGSVDSARMLRREMLVDLLNADFASRVQGANVTVYEELQKAALDFMNSDRLSVFELNREPEAVRKRYGENMPGKALLLARRLAAIEVPFIEISIGGWDTHDNNRDRIAKIASELDPALATFLADLDSSGLLKQTLFILSSEFGRTPDVSSNGDGRDHHPKVWTTLIGGGPLGRGRVIGQTDEKGARPVKDEVTVAEQMATIYAAAGLKTDAVLTTSFGRPFQLVPGSRPIQALF